MTSPHYFYTRSAEDAAAIEEGRKRRSQKNVNGYASVPEVAKYFKVTTKCVQKWIRKGCPVVFDGWKGPGQGAVLDIHAVGDWLACRPRVRGIERQGTSRRADFIGAAVQAAWDIVNLREWDSPEEEILVLQRALLMAGLAADRVMARAVTDPEIPKRLQEMFDRLAELKGAKGTAQGGRKKGEDQAEEMATWLRRAKYLFDGGIQEFAGIVAMFKKSWQLYSRNEHPTPGLQESKIGAALFYAFKAVDGDVPTNPKDLERIIT